MIGFKGCNLMEIIYDADGVTPIGKFELDITVTNITADLDNSTIDCDLYGEIKLYAIGDDGTYEIVETIPVALEGAELSGDGNS